MEKSLETIIKTSDRLLAVKMKRQSLKERFDANITFGMNGGIFKIDQTLISFVNTIISLGKTKNVVLLDVNQTPIVIEDLSCFLQQIVDQYFMSLGAYHAGYQDLKK
jgi:spore germination protein GerM